MFPLHKAPRGLLEIFRLRTLGANPPQFDEVVRPSTDVTEFYAADLKDVSSPNTGTAGALPVFNTLTIDFPVRVHAIGGSLVVGAAPATNVTLEVGVLNQGGVSCGLGSFFVPAAAAGQYLPCTAVVPGIVFAPPQRFYCRVHGTAAGADHTALVTVLIDNLSGLIG